MTRQTPLYSQHCLLKAQMADFAGWQMPLNYGSQINEHHAVRRHAGMFDVSHMGVVDIKGVEAGKYLRYLLANDINKVSNGKALYTCLLNPLGGVIDDLIVYRLTANHYRIVVNASRREIDIAWFILQAEPFQVAIELPLKRAMIAVQGPDVISLLDKFFPKSLVDPIKQLSPFGFLIDQDWHIARTGYTGEDGLEVILPEAQAVEFWQKLLAAGVQPCGLGSRDTLRLEAGLDLYGVDMTETTTPLESNLAWTVAWQDSNRDFIGREALLKQKQCGLKFHLVGLVMKQPGVLRNHQKVKLNDDRTGEITSGSFSPTLGYAIALARIPVSEAVTAWIERRGEWIAVSIVKPPFVKREKNINSRSKHESISK